MKRIFYVLMGVLLMASCSKEDKLGLADFNDFKAAAAQQEINFGTGRIGGTRAIISGTTFASSEAFRVFGYTYASSDAWSGIISATADSTASGGAGKAFILMDDAKCEFNDTCCTGGAWRAEGGPYFWVKNDYKYAFAAYYPATVSGDYDVATKSYKFNNYKDSLALGSQDDLMFSNVVKDINYANKDSLVPIKFNHALAQIEFQAKKNSPALTVTINSISFHAKNKGNGAITNDTISWSDRSGSRTYAVGSTAYNLTDNYVPYGTNALVIPQDVDVSDVYATINYTAKLGIIRVADKTVNISLKPDGTGGFKAWEPGKKYVYQICIDLKEILFNVSSVSDWTSGNGAGTVIY